MKIFNIIIPKKIYLPIIIVLVSIILEKILKFLINKMLNPKKFKKLNNRKVNTIKSLVSNIVKYIIWIIAILEILNVFGVNTTAIITGLGVASLVIGLAFQDILKDILVGFSIIFEQQFAVGDLVKIADFEGYVISLGLKTTRIKSNSTGEIKIISNRNISEVINYSLDKMNAIVDLPVSYNSDIDYVLKILNDTCLSVREKVTDITGEVRVLGINDLTDSSVVYRIIAPCNPGKHYEVRRRLRKEFKISLDKNGIEIPYNQIVVHNEK